MKEKQAEKMHGPKRVEGKCLCGAVVVEIDGEKLGKSPFSEPSV